MSLFPQSYPNFYPYGQLPNPQLQLDNAQAAKGRSKVFSLCVLIGITVLSYIVLNVLLFTVFGVAFGNELYSNEMLKESVSLLVQMVSLVVPFAVLSLYGRRFADYDWYPSKKVKPRKFISLALCCTGLTFVGIYSSNIIAAFFRTVGMGYNPPVEQIEHTPFLIVLSFISSVIVPAFCEEFAFRGVLIGIMKPFGLRFAVVGSAIVFGLAHLNMFQAPFSIVMGLVAGTILIKTGNIWITIASHALVNLSAWLGTYLTPLSPVLGSALYLCYFFIMILVSAVLLILNLTDGTLVIKKSTPLEKRTRPLSMFFASPSIIVLIIIFLIYSFSM